MRLSEIVMGLMVVALFSACASNSAYAPAEDADDYGYYTSRITDERFRVTFNGNSSTGPNTVKDYALLRAAELTLQEGHDWFQVVNRETDKKESSRPAAETSIRQDRVVERDCGLLGCTTTSRPVTATTVGIDARDSRERYSTSLEIIVGKGPMPRQDGSYYDADELASQLRSAM